MYAWIWRKLPFGVWGKLTGSLALLAATGSLLWYVVFPWATPLLPFGDVQVGTGSQLNSGPAQQDPNAVTPHSDNGPGAAATTTRPTTRPTATVRPTTTRPTATVPTATVRPKKSTGSSIPGD